MRAEPDRVEVAEPAQADDDPRVGQAAGQAQRDAPPLVGPAVVAVERRSPRSRPSPGAIPASERRSGRSRRSRGSSGIDPEGGRALEEDRVGRRRRLDRRDVEARHRAEGQAQRDHRRPEDPAASGARTARGPARRTGRGRRRSSGRRGRATWRRRPLRLQSDGRRQDVPTPLAPATRAAPQFRAPRLSSPREATADVEDRWYPSPAGARNGERLLAVPCDRQYTRRERSAIVGPRVATRRRSRVGRCRPERGGAPVPREPTRMGRVHAHWWPRAVSSCSSTWSSAWRRPRRAWAVGDAVPGLPAAGGAVPAAGTRAGGCRRPADGQLHAQRVERPGRPGAPGRRPAARSPDPRGGPVPPGAAVPARAGPGRPPRAAAAAEGDAAGPASATRSSTAASWSRPTTPRWPASSSPRRSAGRSATSQRLGPAGRDAPLDQPRAAARPGRPQPRPERRGAGRTRSARRWSIHDGLQVGRGRPDRRRGSRSSRSGPAESRTPGRRSARSAASRSPPRASSARSCRTPHHRDCWEFVGACSIFGCNGKQSVPA